MPPWCLVFLSLLAFESGARVPPVKCGALRQPCG